MKRETASYITEKLVERRWLLLAIAGLLAIISYPIGGQLALDRSIDTMFAANDPLLPPYHHLKETFQGNDMILCVYEDHDFLKADHSGMQRAESIAKRLEKVDGVRGALTLGRPLGPRVVEKDNAVAEDVRNLFEGFTHGQDEKTVCIALILKADKQTTEERMATIDGIRAVVADLPDGMSGGVVTGEPVMLDDAFRLVEADGQRLFWLTTVLLSLIILVSFRSLRWVLIPVLVVQLALLLTRGTLALAGIKMTMVSSMLTAVVTVVGIATAIHIIVRFREGRLSGLSPKEAFARASRRLVAPIFWACFTDAIGFSALMAANVAPVRDFGFMMAVGTGMVFVSVILLVPGLALLFEEGDNSPSKMWGESTLGRQLQGLLRLSQNHAGGIALSLVILVAFSIFGMSRLQLETDFTKNFRSDSDLVKAYELVETNLGGAGLCDIVLPAPESLDWDYLKKIITLENRLRKQVQVENEEGESEPGLTKIVSIADVLDSVSPFDIGRMRPFLRRGAVNAALGIMHTRIPAFYEAMYSQNPEDGQHYYRIMMRVKERQPSEQKLAIIKQIKEVCASQFANAAVEEKPQVTGYFVLLTNLINGILQDQWRTFTVALMGIGMTMFVAMRSFRMALIALVPNALPILLVNGFMGGFGIKANLGAAMIAAVSVGLSVDSSIHYLFAYRRARRDGFSVGDSLEQVQDTVGRALVFSTIALIVGFTGLAISDFIPTVYFGTLVSLAMLGGMLGNLLWLPALIRLTESDRPAEIEAATSVGL